MNNSPFFLLASWTCLATGLSAAIPVGGIGQMRQTFNTAPAITEWSTRTAAGASSDISFAGDLDAAVQLLTAESFTDPLSTTTILSPTPAVNGRALWNATGQFVQTRPAGVAFVVLMATLRNDSGRSLFTVDIGYDFGVANRLPGTVAEEIPGCLTYFSLTGAAGSWQFIPELYRSSAGPICATLALISSPWPPGGPLYILWADDNASSGASEGSPSEGAYTMDNFIVQPGDIAIDPQVGIVSPANGQVFAAGDPIRITVESFIVCPIVRVEFYATDEFGLPEIIGEARTAPFSLDWTNAPAGEHSLTALAYLATGGATGSWPVRVTVSPRLILTTGHRPSAAELAWPLSATGYQLHSTTTLVDPMWEPALEPDFPADGFHHVTVEIGVGTRFFRLIKP